MYQAILKAKEMCNEAVSRKPHSLGYVPDHFKTKKMCEKTVEEDPCFLHSVRDWFVTQQQIKI